MPLDLTHFRETARSQRGAVVVYRYGEEFYTKLVADVFSLVADAAKELLKQLYDIHSSMKVEIIVGVRMEREQTDEDGNTYMQEDVMYFVSKHEMHSLVKQYSHQVLQRLKQSWKNSFLIVHDGK